MKNKKSNAYVVKDTGVSLYILSQLFIHTKMEYFVISVKNQSYQVNKTQFIIVPYEKKIFAPCVLKKDSKRMKNQLKLHLNFPKSLKQ